jgi:RimJ/RimL family protein N-acetyltransferase
MLPTLYADRIELRPWHEDDVDAVFDLYSRWEVMRYLGSNPRVLTDTAQAAAKIEAWQQFEGPLHGVWAIVPDGGGIPLGTALMKLLPLSGSGDPSADTEVGWHLHPDAWGHGYASEAGARLLHHGWSHGLREIYAVTYPQNAASQAVCGRIGMAALGTTAAYYDLTCSLFRADVPAPTIA